MDSRFDRNITLFGQEGQRKLQASTVAIVGCGGLGTHAVQQLAYLGVGKLALIEHGFLKSQNLNRYIGAYPDDVGKAKVEIAARHARLINPDMQVQEIPKRLESPEAFDAIKASDYVFGCLDEDGARSILNELCLAYRKPLIDLATDVPEPGYYGGRIAVIRNGQGCLRCLGLLSETDIRRYVTPHTQLAVEAAAYGVPVEQLKSGTGPSVVSLNGVVASAGVTEFLVMATGMREPTRLQTYHAHESVIRRSKDDPKGCYYCEAIFGQGEETDVERYCAFFSGRDHGSSYTKAE